MAVFWWKLLVVILGLLLFFTLAASVFFFWFAILRHRQREEDLKKMSPTRRRWKQAAREGKAWMEQSGQLEEVTIRSEDGLLLKGHLLLAERPTDKTVLAIHGYHSTGLMEYGIFARYYHRMGLNLFMPDDRAHGESEGRFIGFGWLDRKDCIAWAKYLIGRFGQQSQIMLHGISMGAATVLMASGEALPKQVKGIVADCGYTSAWEEFAHQMRHGFHLPVFPILHLTSCISQLLAKYGFKEASAVEAVKRATVPIVFIHGTRDTYVPTEMVHPLYDACPTEKELVLVEGAAHALSYMTDPGRYEETLTRFLTKLHMG